VSNLVSIRSLVAPVGAWRPAASRPVANSIAGRGRLAAVMTVDPLLDRIDAYCDAVPRTAARAETHGPLTLFVNDGPGWSFYARPTRGTATVTPTDVDRVRARQRQLGIPETFEWIAEVTPSLAPAAKATGLAVTDHPLLVLEPVGLPSVPRRAGVQLRLVGPDDDLAAITAVAHVGFAYPGTAIGPVGAEALRQAAARRDPAALGFERARLQAGLTVLAVALLDGQPAAVGGHQPVGPVTEVVGVATLPVWRRRGLGAAVTALLVQDAGRRGAEMVFLSAGDDAVARVYERLGFRRVGFHRAAEPAQ
jgi:ribosomal protein S18 acetylase RimI-like enzyme